MDTRSRRVFVAALVLTVAVGVITPATVADSHEYRISVNDSVPIPEQTREIDESGIEGEFVFTGIRAVDPGEEFTAEVSGIPDRESPTLNLKEFVDGETLRDRDFEYLDGDGRATFSAPEDPGLYFLAVDTGTLESLYPIIVQEYNVDVDWDTVPDSAKSGTEISVSAEITRSANPEDRTRVRYVDIVIANDEGIHSEAIPVVDGSETSFTVSGSITVDEDLLSPDDSPYSVYVAARGSETLEGLRVPVGVSEQRTLEVEDSPISTGSTGESTGSTTAPETTTDTDDSGPLPTLRPPNGTLQPTNDPTPTGTEGGILTPGGAETKTPGGGTTTDGQPGLTVAIGVIGIMIAAALLCRR